MQVCNYFVCFYCLGEIQPNNLSNPDNASTNISSPPPGLDRMVLGQITENESVPMSEANSSRLNQSTFLSIVM